MDEIIDEVEKVSLDDILNYQSGRKEKTSRPPAQESNDNLESDTETLGEDPSRQGVFAAAEAAASTEKEKPGKESTSNAGASDPSRSALLQARFVANVIDMGASKGLQAVAKHETSKPFKAEKEDQDELIDQIAIYIEQTGSQLSPIAMIVLLIVMIYVTKIPQALQLRKINTRRQRETDAKDQSGFQKERPSSSDTTSDEPEVVEAEEVTDLDLELEREMQAINMAARAENLPEFKNYKPLPGFCKYEWMIKGEKVEAQEGLMFANKSNMGRWSQLIGKYRRANVPLPRMAILD
ncbi:hypothetical protein [Phaeocystidibacter luteus]|uniref:Uncharacterized protein n=1 Tax=Phaeocystidibacter luteus TaxID=911197 RepID=A0A6N6RLY4_9FLAO|nr:hypothetical protein [Phaeocystidibacter luteus]KAB2814570.1 hypothetical protein F8C67_02185 [Phaeocystidibacter luteus]